MLCGAASDAAQPRRTGGAFWIFCFLTSDNTWSPAAAFVVAASYDSATSRLVLFHETTRQVMSLAAAGPVDEAQESWAGDVTAGLSRAVLRTQQAILSRARATRVSALKTARNLDRLSTAADATDVARGVSEESGGLRQLYDRRGGVGFARSIAMPFASAAVSGTVLFAVYEEAVARAQDRPATHVAAGALGGVAYASSTNVLSALSTGSAAQGVRLLAAHLPRACVADGAEWATAFGVYDITKRWLLDAGAAAPVAEDEHAEVSGSLVAAVAASGCTAGLSQSAVSQLVHTGRLSLRSAVRAAPAAGLGFAAWELGRAAGESSGGSPKP